MDESEMTTRLIRAENELRDLKTAHNRGLGTIKLFSQLLNVNKPATTGVIYGDIYFTIAIASDSEPFPMIRIYPKYTTANFGVPLVNRIKLSDDGYIVYMAATIVMTSAAATYQMKIVSTSEIQSVSYTIGGI